MSLVAYNASDDSEGDDSDGETSSTTEAIDGVNRATQSTKRGPSLGHISDEDEYDAVSSSSLSSSVVQPSFIYSNSGVGTNTLNSAGVIDSTSLTTLEDLPAPLSTTSVNVVEEAELEDEVKPKRAEIESAQKPPSKKKQPIRITIPSLEETQIEDQDDNTKKKPVSSQAKSGLFSLLPPPVHSAKKEINRPLIPHTLTKKPLAKEAGKVTSNSHAQQKPSTSADSMKHLSGTAASKKMALNVAMYGSDSDEEDDVSVSNFFSLGSKHSEMQSNLSKNLQSEEVSSSETPATSAMKGEIQTKGSSFEAIKSAEEEAGEKLSLEASNPHPELGAANDLPLDFRSSSSHGWAFSSLSSTGHLGAVGLAGPVISTHTSAQDNYTASASAQYNMVGSEEQNDFAEDSTAVADGDLKQFMSDKEFQRLSGKRKRGLEDAINFVEANVDDYVDPSEVSKHLTEETEYVSHKNKDNMPTAQQRRKKQITYLAYQAKEREMELKNSWAHNRMTKKQTQSKYGF